MQRPVGLTAIAVFDFIGGAIFLNVALIPFVLTKSMAGVGGNTPFAQFGAVSASGYFLASLLVSVLLGLFSIAIGVGLIKFRNWARLVSIFFAVLGVVVILVGLVVALLQHQSALSAVSYVTGAECLAWDGWITWYLLSSKVKQAFAPAQG